MPSRAAELLAADPFAGFLGVRLEEALPVRVVVSMDPGPDDLDGEGRLERRIAFALADCAMSLISNIDSTSVAVSAHLVASGRPQPDIPVAATATLAHDAGRAKTWSVVVTSGETTVARYTGTTLTLDS